jgi:hypothetical protein
VAASEATPFALEDGVANAADVEALWEHLAASGKLGSAQDAEAARMIERRLSKEHPEGE